MLDQRIRSIRTRVLVLAALCGLLVLNAPSVGASAAAPSTGSGGARPTIVLVHGAWADGSSWSDVVRRLHRAGYPVRVPPNPLRGLSSDTATVVDFLSTVPGPVILVGHSYGGAVITNAAAGRPQVKALVYVNAFVPDEGEAIAPLAGPDSALAADPATVFDFVPYPGAPTGDVDLYLKRSVFLTSFATGVPAGAAAVLYATQRPIALSALNQPSGAPAWKTIPSWYLVGTQDRIIPAPQQRFMAQRAGARTVEVDAGHLSLITRPRAVERLILDAVRATR